MATSTSCRWILKRYARFLPGSKGTKLPSLNLQVFEAEGSKRELVLTIVESGHMLVSLGQELLGESRLMRMQFGGSKAEAQEECSSAVVKLTEYLPVTTQDETASPSSCVSALPNQPPTATTTTTEQTAQREPVTSEPEMVHGSLSIQRLAQHFIGQQGLSLPLVYRHSPLPAGDLEPFLRACLLDSSFPAFVEEVEGEMRKLLLD
ncbi:meiotic recombination protein REC114 isoform X5 [Gadus chalcogrammus]|uniref:meiotic recombination protein REC114 isoform X5 n=1 Tax=Gadus chalcogrammus TaxID=1042646 RepID=UPI0024C49C87|nr:meiotic recombination protein REC114 isoform X5 [Gadus chalcogrammus]